MPKFSFKLLIQRTFFALAVLSLLSIFPQSDVSAGYDQQTQLIPSDPAAANQMGYAVDMSGNLGLIGFPGDADRGTDTGSAYIYHRLTTLGTTTWYKEAKLTAPDANPGDRFGSVVLISGDYAVIGVPNRNGNQGAIYIYERKSSESWQMQVILTADDGAAGDEFGASLHMGGTADTSITRIAVGAPGKGAGAVYLFELDSDDAVPSWVQVKKLTPADGAAGDRFGASVYSNRLPQGEFAIIGSPYDDDLGTDSGSVYVYNYVGANTWDQEAKLNADDGAAGDHLGQSMVSIYSGSAGFVTIVGAPDADKDSGTILDTGAVYTFKRNAVPAWVQEKKLTQSDADANDHFGADVDAYIDRYAIIGAPGDDAVAVNAGAAYVFEYAAFGYDWTERKKLIGGNSATEDAFGSSVSIDSDVPGFALVGAAFENAQGIDSGTVYAYIQNDPNIPNSVWIQNNKLLADNTMIGDNFGSSFAVDGNYAVVGAVKDADGGSFDANTFAGSAYIFFKSGGIWGQQARLTVGDGGRATQFGKNVAISGDTAIVSGANAVFVYVRDGTQWTQQAILKSDVLPGSGFGSRIALDGDNAVISGDGSIYFFKRTGSNWNLQNKFTGGGSIAIDGNWAVIGTNGYGTGGGAHIYNWNGSNWTFVTTVIPPNNDAFSTNQSFGTAVDISGTTIAVGAYRFDNVTNEVGAIYIFAYDGVNWVFQQRIMRSNPRQLDKFGLSVSLEGNRLAVGMPEAFNDLEIAFVFRKIGSSWTQVQSITRNTGSDAYSQTVVLENSDLWVTAPLQTVGGATQAGSVYAYQYTPDADLTVELLDIPGWIAGFDMTYEVTVTNNGQENTTGMSVVDTLPAGVTFLDASAGCSLVTNVVTCAVGNLNIGESATVFIDVNINGTATGILMNQATVTSALPDPNPADNTATQQTQIVPSPGVPTPISPADGSTTTNTTPTFNWTPVSGIVDYDIQLDTMNPPQGYYSGFNVGATFKPPAPLLYMTYYWRVRSVDEFGIPSPWSNTFVLVVNAGNAVAPIRTLSQDAFPTVSWSPVTWATAYEVEIAADSKFETFVLPSGELPATATTYTSLDELSSGTWYWRVRARKEDGSWSAWSAVETLQVIAP